jgi:hypothetical protein
MGSYRKEYTHEVAAVKMTRRGFLGAIAAPIVGRRCPPVNDKLTLRPRGAKAVGDVNPVIAGLINGTRMALAVDFHQRGLAYFDVSIAGGPREVLTAAQFAAAMRRAGLRGRITS